MKAQELDHGVPLSYLKDHRRTLIERLKSNEYPPSTEQLQEIATAHMAVLAAEAVIAEMDAEL